MRRQCKNRTMAGLICSGDSSLFNRKIHISLQFLLLILENINKHVLHMSIYLKIERTVSFILVTLNDVELPNTLLRLNKVKRPLFFCYILAVAYIFKMKYTEIVLSRRILPSSCRVEKKIIIMRDSSSAFV